MKLPGRIPRMKSRVFRDGYVHVMSRMCDTCIFRRGNLMHLEPGRVREMVDASLAYNGAIVCHDTLDDRKREHGICRGFFDRHKNNTMPLRLAQIVGNIREMEPPPK